MNWLCLCKQHGGSVDHLLLYRQMARELWSFFLCLFGVQWVMPNILVSWKGRYARHGIRDIWNATPLCIMWKERNSRTS